MTSNAPNNAPSGPAAAAIGVNNPPSTGGPPQIIPQPPNNALTGPAAEAMGVSNPPSTGGPPQVPPQPISFPSFPIAGAGAVAVAANGNGTVLLPVNGAAVLFPVYGAGGKKKRKNAAPALNIMRRKRIRPTLIDDRVVISFFRELRMTRQFIHSGALLAWSLNPTDPDFINIHDYAERGQEHGYGVKIISIIRIIAGAPNLASDNEVVDFNDNPQTKGQRRMMLWHGTKKRCLSNILQNGLRMPTYTGQMFGPGIYFADRVSKSCNYCDRNADGGFLLLCDVLLGTSYEAFNAIPRLRAAPQAAGGVQTQSVVGLGRRIPEPSWDMTIDGTIWPLGKTIDRNDARAYLQFNEYVVYDTAQVMPKYLVKFQFTQAPYNSVLY